MSEITQSLRKHRRLNNMLFQSRMSLKKGKYVGPYQIQDFLEEGSYSKIYLAKSLYTNEQVVIKAINKSSLKKELDDLLLLTKQIETLKILKHRNIITLYEIYESRKYLYLITEYCQGKNLIEKLMRKKRFSEEEALIIFFQLLDVFTYMHKMNICHRNIRAEHILFDKNSRPKLIGFGYSSFYEKNKKIEGAYGSLCYACPEIINEQPYNPELADVWSLGVILYVLVCGYLPFCEEEDSKNKILISEGKIEFPKEMSNKLKDLLRHMLDINPEKRYNFQKIVKHPWIKPYSESFFSQGINIYKTIYPVDEKILNIIKEYNFDKDKIKNDLIDNKYNTGTGLYKQIVRKLLDMKIKTISDLFCEEFNDYRDNDKNKYENGNEKYEEFIQKVAEYYNKKEDFVNNFKQREDDIVEKLMALKEQKEEEKKLNELKVINEENHSNKEDENENENDNDNNNDNNNNLINNNIEIVYNNEQDIDVLQQFKEKQNKQVIDESEQNKNKNSTNPNKKLNYSLNISESLNKDSVPSSSKFNKNINSNKSIVRPNLLKSTIGNLGNSNSNINNFRMTAFRRSNTKTYFDKGSLYDDFLKKNHPENLKRTMLKSRFGNIYENNNKDIIEDIKEKDESESEKGEKESQNKNDDIKGKEKEEKKSKKDELRYSFNFDEVDEDDAEENKEENDSGELIDIIDGEGDSKLFERFKDDNDEQMNELKKYWFGGNLKASVKIIKKSILNKKSVKFKEDVDKKDTDKKNNSNKKNSEVKRTGTNTSGFELDEYEEKLKEFNKNLEIANDKDEDCYNNLDKLKLDSHLEKNLHDNSNKKSNLRKKVHFNNEEDISKTACDDTNNYANDVNNINNLSKKICEIKYNKALPCKKLKVNEDNTNNIDEINYFFLEKFQKNINTINFPKKNNPEFFRGLTTTNNNIPDKKDESTQTTFINKYNQNKINPKKFQLVHSFFSIKSNKNKNNKANDNYSCVYNGNNQININRSVNPVRLNFNRNQIIQNKQKELDQKMKMQKYYKLNNKFSNNTTNNIKDNKELNLLSLNKSQFYRYKYDKNLVEPENNNYYITETHLINTPNKNIRTILRKNNYNIQLTPEKKLINTKNVKNEVIVKRNEIIEKIQHCQNILNSMVVDKNNDMNNVKCRSNYNINKTVDDSNYNLTFNKEISDFRKNNPKKIININTNNNVTNQVYKKNNLNINTNFPSNINNFTYKKANIKYIDKTNDIYQFDNLSRDNTYNSISIPEYNNIPTYYTNTNKNYNMKLFTYKGLKKYLDMEENLNNHSFNDPRNQMNKQPINTGFNISSYMLNTKNIKGNKQLLNKTFNEKMKGTYTQNVYQNKKINNINDINENPLIKRLKGY